jgi:hypothetical protein
MFIISLSFFFLFSLLSIVHLFTSSLYYHLPRRLWAHLLPLPTSSSTPPRTGHARTNASVHGANPTMTMLGPLERELWKANTFGSCSIFTHLSTSLFLAASPAKRSWWGIVWIVRRAASGVACGAAQNVQSNLACHVKFYSGFLERVTRYSKHN